MNLQRQWLTSDTELELKEGNPVRVQNIFERRITDHCLEPDVWTEYVNYLEKNLKDYQSSKMLLKRAVRNCTWSSRLWIRLLRCYERLECPRHEILQVMENALQSGLATPQDYRDVWLAYIGQFSHQLFIKLTAYFCEWHSHEHCT